jgi:hypothetical protein
VQHVPWNAATADRKINKTSTNVPWNVPAADSKNNPQNAANNAQNVPRNNNNMFRGTIHKTRPICAECSEEQLPKRSKESCFDGDGHVLAIRGLLVVGRDMQ